MQIVDQYLEANAIYAPDACPGGMANYVKQRVFSSAKLQITNHRSRLKSDIIEANSISRPVLVRIARVLYTKGPRK